MQLRTFLAKDMKSALADVRTEMGLDAVIIASEKTRAGVLVRAALDRNAGEAAAPDPEPPETANDAFELRYHGNLIRRLRGDAPAAHGRRHFDRGELLAIFARHRLPDALAHQLAEESAKTGLADMTLALAAAIDARMVAMPVDIDETAALLLIGPGGAGKSACAAKLAAHARLAGRMVRLIAADTEGAGAVARLTAFAEHLDAEIVTAASVMALAEHCANAIAENRLAIIDTAGFDPRSAKAATAFAALGKLADVETIGVIAAPTDSEEAGEIAGALHHAGAARLIVTQLDMTRRYGALLATALGGYLGLAHVTRSPFVAGGLETMTPLMLARMLIETEGKSVQ
jgi:flagellar biosynthesis protein FlhF